MANTDNDKFAKKLALETLENSFGSARVRAVARAEFLNGVDIAHGGFLFTVADFASALAVNTDERVAGFFGSFDKLSFALSQGRDCNCNRKGVIFRFAHGIVRCVD